MFVHLCSACFVQGFSKHRRMCYGGFTDMSDGRLPPARTHENVEQDAARAAKFVRDKVKVDTAATHGVLGRSAWLQLPYFDIVQHTLLDMMHLCSGVVGRHLVPLVQGKRLRDTMQAGDRAKASAAAVAQRKKASDAVAEEAKQAREGHAARNKRRKKARRSRGAAAAAPATPPDQSDEEREPAQEEPEPEPEAEHKESLSEQQKKWQMSEKMMLRIEEACYQHIRAPQGVAPLTKRPLTQTSEMQAHQWINFVKVYGKYLLSQHFKGDLMAVISNLLDLIKLTLRSTVDQETMDEIERLRNELAPVLESAFPSTEWSMVLHLLFFHIPDTIRLWGPTRGYWCFPFERSDRQGRLKLCCISTNVGILILFLHVSTFVRFF